MPMQLPPALAAVSARLNQFGFERTRRALAALALSAFVTLYFLVGINPDLPEGLGRVFLALSVCYGVAFVGVVAELFWGRWFATGLAWSGIMMAVAVMFLVGWIPQLAVFGGLHLLVAVALMGKKMAARYDMQEAWRARYKMDEYGVARLRKAVTSTAASLPSMIMWALGPKEEGLAAVGALAALGLAVFGLRGLVRMRSWGALSLGGAAAVAGSVLAASSLVGPTCHCMAAHVLATGVNASSLPTIMSIAAAPMAVAFLVAAALPFAGAIVRYLRRPAQ